MPVRRKKTQRGMGFFTNFVLDKLLNNGAISKIGSMIPNPTIQKLAGFAKQKGLAKRRRKRRVIRK